MAARMSTSKRRARAAARLAAVQALYQQDMETIPLARLLHEFHQHRLGATIEDTTYADAEVPFFDDVVQGVDFRRAEIDGVITANLSTGWTFDRLDKPLAQILRAGTYELIARADIPTASIINDYLDVAHAFYDRKEKGFVNGVLDAVAKAVRG
jgi:transcription antitermination protein NusB